jgi:hypothetical protein
MTIENDADERREKKKKKKKKKKNNFGLRRSTRSFLSSKYPKYLSVICPPFLSAIGSARNQKNLLNANGPFILCVKILIASATRFAAFRAEKEEREKETRASSYLLRRERERESFCRAIHRLSKKRFEQNDYLILSRLTVCACVGFAVEIL